MWMGCRMVIEKLYVFLVVVMMLAGLTPVVFAVTEDEVLIFFDPDGEIDIDIAPEVSYNFSSVQANSWANSTGGTFTLFNNGTIAMDTQIKTNASTDETDMDLNASGTPPQQDEYAINITGLDLTTNTFLTSSYSVEFDQQLLPDDSKTFDVCLLIGVNLSANHSWQTTTISFQGSQS